MGEISDVSALEALREKVNLARRGENARPLKANWENINKNNLDDIRNFECKHTFEGHYGKIYDVQSGCDDTRFLSASVDGKLVLWDPTKIHNPYVGCFQNNAAGHFDRTRIQQFNVGSKALVLSCGLEKTDCKHVAAGDLHNNVTVFKVQESYDAPPIKQELKGAEGYISSIKFPERNEIICSSGDASCLLFDIEKSVLVNRFRSHQFDIMAVDVDPTNSNIFVSASIDCQAKLWDKRTPTQCSTFYGHQADINSVSFFPDGNAFATGSDDTSCRLFDKRTLRSVNVFAQRDIAAGCTSVAMSKSGRLIFGGYEDCIVRAWDITGKTKKAITMGGPDGHVQRVMSVAVTGGGSGVLSAGFDLKIKLWV